MNAEQKQQIEQALRDWETDSSDMFSYEETCEVFAALLQELVDAPEEFESLTRNEDGTVSLKPGFKAVAYTAQEALPATNPAQISSLAEPFGYFKAEPFGWTDCAETDDGAIALYTAPPAPSVPEAEPVARVTGYYAGYLSIATVDGLVLPTGTALYTAPTAAEPPADVARDAERLDWLLRKLPGVVLRYCVGVLSDTSDGKEFREAIDAAIEREILGGGE